MKYILEEQSFKKQTGIWMQRISFFVFFFIGIVLSNIWYGDYGIENELLDLSLEHVEEWNQYSYFLEVCLHRIPEGILLFVLGLASWKYIIYTCFVSWQGFALGYFASENILNYGWKGIANIFRVIMPHYPFYIAAFIFLVHMMEQRERKRGYLIQDKVHLRSMIGYTLVIVLFAAGIVGEGVWNLYFV